MVSCFSAWSHRVEGRNAESRQGWPGEKESSLCQEFFSLPPRIDSLYFSLRPHSGSRTPVFRLGRWVMSSAVADLDFIEELRMRRWAGEHYAPAENRDGSWHPIVHDEMDRKDA